MPAGERESQDEIMAADMASLTEADIPPEAEEPDPGAGMPEELLALSAQELEELYAAAPAVVPARPATPAWPLSWRTPRLAGPGQDEPGGTSAGCGFAQGEVLDSAPGGLVLAEFADDASAELASVADDPLVGLLRAWRRVASWAQGRELAIVAELARRRPADGYPPAPPGQIPAQLSEFTADEIAAALTLTLPAAKAQLALAVGLIRRPALARALATGRIDLAKARLMVEVTEPLGLVAAAAVVAAALPEAAELTTGQLRALLGRLVLLLDPQAARRRREQAEKQARVEWWADPEGTATLAGRNLPPAQVLAADARLGAIARAWKKAGAVGGMDTLRAAAYLALLLGLDTDVPPSGLLPPVPESAGPSSQSLPPGEVPPHHPAGASRRGHECVPVPAGLRRPAGDPLAPLAGSVHLTIPMLTLLGLADAPGEAAGYGPLHADTCRELADAMAGHPATQWGVIITDGTGRAMGLAGPARPRRKRAATTPGTARGSPTPPSPGGWTITLTSEPIAPYR